MKTHWLGLTIGGLCGAATGFVATFSLTRIAPAALTMGLVGLCLGASIGANVLKLTGWSMILGAILGGVASILITQHGKGSLYGAPLGTIAGFAVGAYIEAQRARSRFHTNDPSENP
ncbi:MAG TPA: hypothetical protein VGZ22_24800 [Isosphaeraceae bacterium]|jgi:hypothetical protein|nr:hypothetical protein [Isosphaeraceae bacterium]